MTTHNANPIHPAFSREQPQSGPSSPFHSCRGSTTCGKKWNLRFDRFETLKAGGMIVSSNRSGAGGRGVSIKRRRPSFALCLLGYLTLSGPAFADAASSAVED